MGQGSSLETSVRFCQQRVSLQLLDGFIHPQRSPALTATSLYRHHLLLFTDGQVFLLWVPLDSHLPHWCLSWRYHLSIATFLELIAGSEYWHVSHISSLWLDSNCPCDVNHAQGDMLQGITLLDHPTSFLEHLPLLGRLCVFTFFYLYLKPGGL